jgi:hypothetical protein
MVNSIMYVGKWVRHFVVTRLTIHGANLLLIADKQ